MRCRTCDYALWNLTTRTCPECGEPFTPDEFDFTPNTVEFRCPYCRQAYFGTTRRGHLDPRSFDCVQCEARIDMNEMVLRPADGVTEAQTQPGRLPWLERKREGLIRAFFKTVGLSLVSPDRLIRGLCEDSSRGGAAIFALIVFVIIAFGGVLLPVALLTLNVVPILVFLTAAGLVYMVGILLWGASAHGVLRMTGGSAHGMSRTFDALLYSSGTLLPMAIPLIGWYCGLIVSSVWWVISATIMIATGQRVHGGRATLAVLAFPVLCGVLLVASYIALMVGLMSNMNTMVTAGATGSPPQFETSSMAHRLQWYVSRHQAFPDHAVQLIDHNRLYAGGFVVTRTSTTAIDADFGFCTLEDLIMQNVDIAESIERVAEEMPKEVIAHRVGDFVFTYHGIDPVNPPTELWLVVYSPDPDVKGQIADVTLYAATWDGSTVELAPGALAARLEAQNALRDQRGLPPLPDPSTIRHGEPAVAP